MDICQECVPPPDHEYWNRLYLWWFPFYLLSKFGISFLSYEYPFSIAAFIIVCLKDKTLTFELSCSSFLYRIYRVHVLLLSSGLTTDWIDDLCIYCTGIYWSPANRLYFHWRIEFWQETRLHWKIFRIHCKSRIYWSLCNHADIQYWPLFTSFHILFFAEFIVRNSMRSEVLNKINFRCWCERTCAIYMFQIRIHKVCWAKKKTFRKP